MTPRAAPLADELLADQLCDQFESAWESAQRPSIEALLAQAPEAARETVLEQLLRAECGLRRKTGERPTELEYLKRFPAAAEVVKRLFAEAPPEDPLATADLATAPLAAGDTVEVNKRNAAESDSLPRRFGDYELLAQLGVGGMGVVYKARQITANRLVALKLVRPDQLASYSPEDRKKLLARFRNEVQAAAALEHDHVVTVYDVGEIDGQSYYAMRLVEGESLKDRLAKGPLEPDVAARYIEQVARALGEAHAHGILHRDLKPHNVMVDRRTDRALLTDFGLAKLAQQDQELTAHGAVFGSPPYMSPEQTIDAGNVTTASDIYGLGATLYHLLTGRPPFHAANPMATLQQVQTAEPTSPRTLNPAVPLDLETICLKCLEKTPANRFVSAAELADRLAKVQRGEPIPERPLSRPARFWRWCRRNPVVASLTLGLATLIVAIAIVSPIVAMRQYRLAGNLELALENTKQARESERESLLKLLVSMDRASDPNTRVRAGWKHEALEQLKQSLPENPDQAHRLAFNSIAADYASATDLVHVADLAAGEPMNCLAFDAAGTRLAMARHMGIPGGWITSVSVFDVATRTELHQLQFQSLPSPSNPNGARSICLSPDGRWLVVGDRFGTVHFWDLSRDAPEHNSFAAHGTATVSHVEFGHEGDLFTSGADRALRRWTAPAADKPAAFPMAAETELATSDAHFSLMPDAEIVTTGGETQVLDARTLKPSEVELDERWRNGLGRAAGMGRALAFAAVQGERLLLIERGMGTALHEFTDPRGKEADRVDATLALLAASADGTLLVTCDSLGSVKLWDILSGRLISELATGSPRSNAAAIAPDGSLLAVTSAVDGKHCVSLWKIDGRHVHRPLVVSPDIIRDFRPLPSGDLAVLTALGREGRIAVYLRREQQDERRRPMVVKTEYAGPPAVLAIDPSGPTLRHTGTGREVFAWNTQTGKSRKAIDVTDLRLLEYSPDGACWAVRGSCELGLWDDSAGFQPRWDNQASRLMTGRGRIDALAAGKQYVAAGASDGSTVIFRRDGAGGLLEQTRLNCHAPVTAVALNAPEELLVFGTQQGKLGTVRLSGSSEPKIIEAHDNQVEALAITADGRRLASAGYDQQILLWSLNDDGQLTQYLALRPQLGPLSRIHFSPDGSKLYALAKGSFGVHVWDLGQLETEFRSTFGTQLIDSKALDVR